MTKPVKLLVGMLVLVVAVSGLWLISKPKPVKNRINDEGISMPTAATQPTDSNGSATIPADSGKYVDYNESLLEQTSGTRLLFFHAPWCPQCRQLEASITASDIPQGVTIFKVDYDTNQALRQKFGVTIQTTVVKLDENANSAEKYVAYEEPTLDSVVKNLLQ